MAAAGSAMIEAQGLTKCYGNLVAVRDLTFTIRAGEVVAFLGPNGAGKSTTMKMVTGYLSPSSGRAWVGGVDVLSDRIAAASRIGYMPENGPLYTDMTPIAMLSFFGQARGMSSARLRERIEKVVHTCGLAEVAARRIGNLSRGYRQRVGLAQALLHEPDVLILDEPTSGLDPNQIREVRRMLKQIGKQKTILLSTHLMQEVEAVATRVLVINDGRLVFDGLPADFEKKGGGTGMDGAFHELTAARG